MCVKNRTDTIHYSHITQRKPPLTRGSRGVSVPFPTWQTRELQRAPSPRGLLSAAGWASSRCHVPCRDVTAQHSAWAAHAAAPAPSWLPPPLGGARGGSGSAEIPTGRPRKGHFRGVLEPGASTSQRGEARRGSSALTLPLLCPAPILGPASLRSPGLQMGDTTR